MPVHFNWNRLKLGIQPEWDLWWISKYFPEIQRHMGKLTNYVYQFNIIEWVSSSVFEIRQVSMHKTFQILGTYALLMLNPLALEAHIPRVRPPSETVQDLRNYIVDF